MNCIKAPHLVAKATMGRWSRQKSNEIAAMAQDFWVNVAPALPTDQSTPSTFMPLSDGSSRLTIDARAKSIALGLLMDRARLNKTIPHYSEVQPMTFYWVLDQVNLMRAGTPLPPQAPCMRTERTIYTLVQEENRELCSEVLSILAEAEEPDQDFDGKGYPRGIAEERDERRIDPRDIEFLYYGNEDSCWC